DFSTVESPNPEDFSAYKMALELAPDYNPDLIMATDPDADRIGLVVKDTAGEYRNLTGNQIGVLLSSFLLEQLRENNSLPANGVIIKTIVSTEMIRELAADYGIQVMDVLTGFKYIGEKIREFEEKGDKNFIFGFEESYGYLAGTYTRDKDAVLTAALIAIMALYYKEQGLSIYEKLMDLMDRYGYYREELAAITLEGKEGEEKINNTLRKLREEKPGSFCGIKVAECSDYQQGRRYNYQLGEEKEISLPLSNVLQYRLEDDSVLTIRPSGTEPKLKIYFMVKGSTAAEADERITELRARFLGEINEILEEV
ncbi:MAG TPA: phospho-sugar mutase, partial [Halanaerobiaceae bacterium]|nr:phospho-sugar mutase [Halanaerobiaceae bacterium]